MPPVETKMKKTTRAPAYNLLAATALVAVTSACNLQNPLAAVVPTANDVRLNVPGADDGGALSRALTQALEVGETSEFYTHSRNLAVGINGSVGGVYRLIENILQYPPTETDGETVAVWGPSEPRGLERNSFRFTVEKVLDAEVDTYTYRLEGRSKDSTEESDFSIIFDGVSVPGDGNKGTGTMHFRFGSLRRLNDNECGVGDLQVAYDATVEPRTLDVDFEGVANVCRGEEPTDARYHYEEAEDGAGSLDFALRGDIHRNNEDKPLLEVLAIRTRWLADGQGRSDVQVSEGEIPGDLAQHLPGSDATTVDFVECWDSSFALVYVDTNPDALEPHLGRAEAGDASLCAFADASFASL
jgi:hypothetical protein